MPTGYTAIIEKGISFEDFVMRCARNFGALITMRDESFDAPIPKEFKPSPFYKKELEQTESKLAELENMSLEEAAQQAKKEYDNEFAYIEKSIREANELREKYMSMLTKAKAWQPPSPDHTRLKEFMEEQITQSIKFDCSTDYAKRRTKKLCLLPAKDWITKEKARLLESLAYDKKSYLEEVERTNGRNIWLKQLRESLNI